MKSHSRNDFGGKARGAVVDRTLMPIGGKIRYEIPIKIVSGFVVGRMVGLPNLRRIWTESGEEYVVDVTRTSDESDADFA